MRPPTRLAGDQADRGDEEFIRINDYGAVKIGIAGPHDIRSWSFGEVKSLETINDRTGRPEEDGLFCERIFGPERDWECACGKYRDRKHRGTICDRCGVEVTHSRVRRERMGHVELPAPVVHIWFLRTVGLLLDMEIGRLERIIYFQDYVVIDPGDTPLEERQLLTEVESRKARKQFGDTFQAGMGADAVRELLARLDLVSLSRQLRSELGETSSKQETKDLTRRLKVVESLRDSDNRPEWMVLECIPVIPPDLRPLVLLDSGDFVTSDLNDLYRRIINRNDRLKKLVDLNAPEVIIRNEKRMLQQTVDALFGSNRRKWPVLGSGGRPLKSLTDMIKGKRGRSRGHRLGKRVDYSARSVIVVGPDLRLHQCGLPKKIALELFQPFIIRRLKELGLADTIESAKLMIERKSMVVGEILEEVIRNHPVLLNRAPTLNRMGIQAFDPVLVEGNAIRIHPLVCKGFNADFDGDRMAVHLPLSIEAQVEAMTLMMSTNNIFSPANGNPIISPTQDIVMGSYYVTVRRPGEPGEGMTFSSPNEVFLAFSQKKVGVHAMINLRLPAHKKLRGEGEKEFTPSMIVKTTTGRVIFNDILHPKMPYYNMALGQNQLREIIADCDQVLGRAETIDLLDAMKDLGFRESTRSGLSLAIDDLKTPASKGAILSEAEPSGRTIETPIKANFREGLSVLEYFRATRGARKRLADSALKAADSGNLTRKLADAAQDVVITMEDCGTSRGTTKGEEVGVSLVQSIRGRVSRVNIVDPTTGEVVVRENEMITAAAARKLEAMRIGKVRVRSPMTCEASPGICRRCYGMDLATGQLVEPGMAVGIIAAQSIGEPGTGHWSRADRRGAPEARAIREGDTRCDQPGRVLYVGFTVVPRDGLRIALSNGGAVEIIDPEGARLARYGIPDGAVMLAEDGRQVGRGEVLCEWDPHNLLILAEVGGRVRFEDIVEGETMRVGTDPSGHDRRTIMEHGGDLRPRILIEDGEGRVLARRDIPEGADIEIREGAQITAGTLLAKVPREVGETREIAGGLPRLIELIEARRPRDPAVIAEIDGRVELIEGERRGRRTILVRDESGVERAHRVPPGKHLRVRGGDRVRAGDALVEGPLVPHDLLRIAGEEAVRRYLLGEIQGVYRSRRVEIDDKHLEIIIAQMLRWVRVDSVGDTGLLPGSVIDTFEFRARNLALMSSVKVKDPGDTDIRQDDLIPRDHFDREKHRVESAGGRKAEWVPPRTAAASAQLLGITEAAAHSESFLSAASLRGTTRVLTEAALAGKVDRLVGLKENVILGRLIPAGTGFKSPGK